MKPTVKISKSTPNSASADSVGANLFCGEVKPEVTRRTTFVTDEDIFMDDMSCLMDSFDIHMDSTVKINDDKVPDVSAGVADNIVDIKKIKPSVDYEKKGIEATAEESDMTSQDMVMMNDETETMNSSSVFLNGDDVLDSKNTPKVDSILNKLSISPRNLIVIAS